ncbi:MAG: HAD-IC family P-type ATPase, partial [Clostridia bacterium]
MMNYYSNKIDEVLAELATSEQGLTSAEAAKRLAENGKNELEQGKKKSMFAKFIMQFKDVMIIVLIAAAVISAAIAIYQREYGELLDSAIIMLIVIINAVIGLVQENKAESALDALKNMNKPFSKVLRGGELIQIKSEELVKGDIVQLDAGDIVPADLRLMTSASLKIEEAALTGESVPSEKDAEAIAADKAPLGDRSNMAYSSGITSYGRGRGIVVETGMNTEVGKIAKMLSESDDQVTPLQKQLDKTAKVLSIIVLAIALVIFGASVIRKTELIDAFMTSVAIAVAAIPEGLPAVVTIVLAIGVQRMSKRKAIIRNLPAVETLGCCEIICSDKTGTLTLNQMTVKQIFTLDGGIVKAEDYNGENGQELLT